MEGRCRWSAAGVGLGQNARSPVGVRRRGFSISQVARDQARQRAGTGSPFRIVTPLGALSSSGGLARYRRAIDAFQGGKDLDHRLGGRGIIDGLRVAPGLHELLCSKLRQVLRQSRLAQAHLGRQNADRNLTLNEAAEDHESLRVCHGGEQASRDGRLFGQCFCFHLSSTFLGRLTWGGMAVVENTSLN